MKMEDNAKETTDKVMKDSALCENEILLINEMRGRHALTMRHQGKGKPTSLLVTIRVTVFPHANQDPVATFSSFFQNNLVLAAIGDPRIATNSRLRPEIEIVKVGTARKTDR
jgi:hypothetical protein